MAARRQQSHGQFGLVGQRHRTSTELRAWFGYRLERFAEFGARYVAELDHNVAVPAFLEAIKAYAEVTLLYGAKDPAVNHAVVLAKVSNAS